MHSKMHSKKWTLGEIAAGLTVLILAVSQPTGQVQAAPATAPAAQAKPAAPILEKQQVKLKDHKQRLDIEMDYPQIKAPATAPITTNAQAFNRLIHTLIDKQVAYFKTESAEALKLLSSKVLDQANWKDFDNYLAGGYEVERADARLISLRFSTEMFMIGNAHPSHQPLTVNFDLGKGREIQLADLFKPGSNYLKLLSDTSRAVLLHEAKVNGWEAITDMIQDGTAPKAANFKHFNLTASALVIVFPEYQVAPYIAGTKEVRIPYTQLRALLAAGTPLADLK